VLSLSSSWKEDLVAVGIDWDIMDGILLNGHGVQWVGRKKLLLAVLICIIVSDICEILMRSDEK